MNAGPRRRILLGLASSLLAPRLALGQAPRIPNVIVIYAGESEDDEPVSRPFFSEMERLGWVEGKTVNYERYSGRGSRQHLAELAKTAASREPDLIYATTTSSAVAVGRASDKVPFVFTTTADPVALGLAKSLEQPGRNATGAYQIAGETAQRRLEVLRDLLPKAKRIGVLVERGAANGAQQRQAHERAAKQLKLELLFGEFTNFEAVAKLVAQFRRGGAGALAVTPSFTLFARRREVIAMAERESLPLAANRAEWVEAGALMSYGPELTEALRRTAGIAHRILKGVSPGAIPIERARRAELAFNEKTANALGVHIPKPLLQQAHRVIK